MKTVYKLQNKYFNIKNIKEISEIEIVNSYEEQEIKKKQDEEIEESLPLKSFGNIPKIRFYFDYEKDCEEISIRIDGIEYTCRNWEVFENNKNHKSMFSCMDDEYRVTKKQQKEFNKFKKEAETLLEAFKKL